MYKHAYMCALFMYMIVCKLVLKCSQPLLTRMSGTEGGGGGEGKDYRVL